MRKILFFFVTLFVVTQTEATITFSRQDSKIRINNNAKLKIGTSIASWTGTLEKRSGSNIAGQNINFEEGILQTETNEGLLTGIYNVAGLDSIELQGDGRFNAQPGTVIHEFKVTIDRKQ